MNKTHEISAFNSDPFGYCSTVWHEWNFVQMRAGFDIKQGISPTSSELKNPILWLSQASSLGQAALNLLKTEPDFSHMPKSMYSICYRQYLSSSLMLFGYSVEVLYKALTIKAIGIEEYTKKESKYFNHKLVWLVEQHTKLQARERAILECLTHFVYWAGRYPDHGEGQESKLENVFLLSEKNQISMKELVALLNRLTKVATDIIYDLTE